MTLRIVTWNCNMALHKKVEPLASLRPDIAIIPECAEPEVVKKKANGFEFNDAVWIGKSTNKLIDKMRIKDKDKIKEMFNNSIDDFMANLSLSKPPDAINNNPSDFKEALNNFANAVYNSREVSDARERIKEETKKMERYYYGEKSK